MFVSNGPAKATNGQPRERRRLSRKIPSREELIEKAKDRLQRHGLPRLQMSLIVALTGGAGFLSSYALLRLGVDSMALRYPVAVAAAYGVFLLLLWMWLVLQRRGSDEVIDAGDAVDLADGALDIAGDAVDGFAGGGGSFGGGGASASFEDPLSLGVSAPAPMPKAAGGKGSGFDFSFDLDEGGCLVLAAVAVMAVAALGTALWIIWTAPILLAEVLVDGLLMAGLYRRLKRTGELAHWLLGAVRRTWIPALITAVLFATAGHLLQQAAPQARSIGAAWKAVRAEEP
jgi:hypothetical protein